MPNRTQDLMTKERKREAKALRECLEYLEGVAAEAEFHLCAHLIGLAKDSTFDKRQPTRGEIEALGGAASHGVSRNGNGQARGGPASLN